MFAVEHFFFFFTNSICVPEVKLGQFDLCHRLNVRSVDGTIKGVFLSHKGRG